MHFSTVIALMRFPSVCKQIPVVEAPYPIFSLCIHAVFIIFFVTGRKIMHPRTFLGVLPKLSAQICLGYLSLFCFYYYTWNIV